MKLNSPVYARLADRLKQEKQRLKSFKALSEAIKRVNNNDKDLTIDRRKLALLAESHPVSLNLLEIQGLNTFLSLSDRGGLSEILDEPKLLTAVAKEERVTFLMSARYQRTFKANMMSVWDFRSSQHILECLYQESTSRLRVDLREVQEIKKSLPTQYMETIRQDCPDWFRLVDKGADPPTSIVALGSPRACPASEVLLANLFGVDPFGKRTEKVIEKLPFSFKLPTPHPSIFVSEKLKDHVDWTKRAIVADGRTYRTTIKDSELKSYAAIVVRRRASGHIDIALAGLSGAETFASAKMLNSFPSHLPNQHPQKPSRLLWAIVETKLQINPSAETQGQDIRQVDDKMSVRFRVEPRLYPPSY